MLMRPGSLPFTDYLKKLPSHWVLEHFFHEDSSSRKILSSSMVEESAEQFICSEGLCSRFSALEPADQLRCAFVYLTGSMGLSTETNGLDDPVVASFLGYAARGSNGKVRIFGFDQFEPLLRPLVTSVILSAASVTSEQQPNLVWEWRACNDIALVASLGAQHLLVKKKSGNLSRAALTIIKKMTDPGGICNNDELDLIAELMVGYSVRRHLLIQNEQEYCFSPEALLVWLQEPLEARNSEIQAYVMEKSGGWNLELLQHLFRQPDTIWLSSAVFQDADRLQAHAALLAMRFFGAVELIRVGEHILFCSVKLSNESDAASQRPVMVMPDFTVVLAQECYSTTLYEFARFGKILSLDRVYHGIIERAVLTEALSSGIPGEEIISSLQQWNAPVNVVETVREWIREFHRLILTNDTFLMTNEESVTKQITAYEPLKACLEPFTVHTVFRVRPGYEETVREIVRKLGFDERIRKIASGTLSTKEVGTICVAEKPSGWTLIVEKQVAEEKAQPIIRGTKYGAELKALDMSEVVQVIDYAILTGQRLSFSYEGSPYVRKAIYTVTPILCSKGPEPLLEGEVQRMGSRKQFYIKKISAIGVVPQ